MRPVDRELALGPITVLRTPARHGYGADAEALAPVSGFLIRADGASLYIAGDTVLYEDVEAILDEQRPDVVVVNASGARFTGGRPIVMDLDQVVAVARRVPGARVVAVHLDAINHCIETRADLHQRLVDERLAEAVTVPEDGAAVPID